MDSPNITRGLSASDVAARLARYGPNALPAKAPESAWHRTLRQFQSPLIAILLFALTVDLTLWIREDMSGFPFEAAVIFAILLLNAGLGVWQESKAEAALASLKKLAAPRAWVLRDAAWTQCPATGLVPEDVVRLDAGDRIPADGILRGPGISVDESMLTGESLPVEKSPADELFGGTLVTRGKSLFEVSRTGTQSALGRLANLLETVQEESTPLERRLRDFSYRIARWVFVLIGVLILQGLISDGVSRLGEIVVFAVALAVAAVPEGLPAVLTSTLSLGVERMARRKAVVRRLTAVEALGSVTVIATDKTGTITENAMHVRRVESLDPERALTAMMLANESDGGAGDPMDLALLSYARSQGADPVAVRAANPIRSSKPFDSADRFMRVTVDTAQGLRTYIKGAPEVVLARCAMDETDRALGNAQAHEHAAQGFRVLALAEGEREAETDIRFLGWVLFWDPPRTEVPAAIRTAREAGIRTIMMTGDHPATATAIASSVGIEASRVMTGDELNRLDNAALTKALVEVNVFARVGPEHKLKIVEALQAKGEIVAMTGDGVNDAPALKRADVGIAMGQRGSDVAREVADLVLLDDNFATIVTAIEEGRSVYENVQKFLRFLFSTNLSEVLVISGGMLLAALLGMRDAAGELLLPLTAVQILWINLVTDGLPALSLAFDRNPGAMRQAPRSPSAPLLDTRSLKFILLSGAVKALLALGLLGLGHSGGVPVLAAQTMAFHFMAMGQLLFVYPARHTSLLPLPNRVLHSAVALGILLQITIGTMALPVHALGLSALTGTEWAICLSAVPLAWAIAEFLNRLFWRRDVRAS